MKFSPIIIAAQEKKNIYTSHWPKLDVFTGQRILFFFITQNAKLFRLYAISY